MIVGEPIDVLNQRLIDKYGKYLNGQAMFRIVWSDDQMENRLMTHTREGFPLLYPERQEVPKYRQYIQAKYILEGLKEVPNFQQEELGAKISYEPIWVFENGNGHPVPPVWQGIELILETMRANIEGNGVKYEDPAKNEADPKIARDVREARINKLEEELFGNESKITDGLAYGTGIVVPGTTQGDN